MLLWSKQSKFFKILLLTLKMPKFYTQFDPPLSTGVFFGEELFTSQEFIDDCDINHIIEKMRTGLDITPSSVNRLTASPRQPIYGDFTDVRLTDKQSAEDFQVEALEHWKSIPEEVRLKFNNDALSLVQAFEDPANKEYFQSVGLITLDKDDVLKSVDSSKILNQESIEKLSQSKEDAPSL